MPIATSPPFLMERFADEFHAPPPELTGSVLEYYAWEAGESRRWGPSAHVTANAPITGVDTRIRLRKKAPARTEFFGPAWLPHIIGSDTKT